MEIQILKGMFGKVLVATGVHDIQVVKDVPFEEKDEKVLVIVTPTGHPCFELIKMKKICKWYSVCPMKRFLKKGDWNESG